MRATKTGHCGTAGSHLAVHSPVSGLAGEGDMESVVGMDSQFEKERIVDALETFVFEVLPINPKCHVAVHSPSSDAHVTRTTASDSALKTEWPKMNVQAGSCFPSPQTPPRHRQCGGRQGVPCFQVAPGDF